jgi:hypothetical protein
MYTLLTACGLCCFVQLLNRIPIDSFFFNKVVTKTVYYNTHFHIHAINSLVLSEAEATRMAANK